MKSLIPTIIVLLLSCNPKTINSKQETYQLLQTAVDATLKLDSGLNRESYLVDVRKVREIDPQAIAAFLQKNHNARLTNLDSLYQHDSNWRSYQFFQLPVISINEIKKQQDGSYLINSSKVKASDGAIEAEIILKPLKSSQYGLVSAKITSIS